MKAKSLPCLTLLAGLALAGLPTGCRSSSPTARSLPTDVTPSQALVSEVRGFGCRAKLPGGSWHKALLGDWLPMGSSVQTGPDSRLTLRLYEAGILVHVKPASELRLEKMVFQKSGGVVTTSTWLNLTKGEVGVENAHLAPGSEFEIHTPQGVTRIPPRGRN